MFGAFALSPKMKKDEALLLFFFLIQSRAFHFGC